MKRFRSLTHRLAGFLAALVLCCMPLMCTPMPLEAATQSQYDELVKAQEELKKEQDKLKKQIASAGNDVEAQQKKLDALKAQIRNVEKQISNCDKQIEMLNASISEKDTELDTREQEITDKEQQISDRFETLRRRLGALDKTGNLSSMQMLLDHEEYTDYLLKSKLIRSIAARDQAMMEEMTRELEDIQRQREIVLGEKAALADDKEQMEAVKQENEAKKKEINSLYVEAKKVETQLEKQLGTYEKKQKELDKEVAAMEKEIQKVLNELKGKDTGSYNGSMQWPVPTVLKISSYFGTRWGKLHKGIDIANGKANGEKIYPAADGTVIYANYTREYGGGYGYYCMVSHGKDKKGREIVTLYAHMQILYARKGDVVKAGQTVLGLIGSTGDSTGPHLHFEVRVDGDPVDPIANGYVKDANKI